MYYKSPIHQKGKFELTDSMTGTSITVFSYKKWGYGLRGKTEHLDKRSEPQSPGALYKTINLFLKFLNFL